MSIFHCPMGAPYRNGSNCINCGMCEAKNKEDYRKACEIVRTAICQEHSSRLDYYKISKIAVCGKGGSGKSTIAALLARCLVDLGYEVLLIDTDESNAGLYKKIGFSHTGSPLLRVLGNGFTEYEEVSTRWLQKDQIRLDEIPEEYVVSNGRLHLLVTGKIMDPFQGCACVMSDLTRELLLRLQLTDRQIVIVDNEAGVESFGRGLERGADMILDVVEPSFDSLELASRIQYMAEGIGIRRIRAILNKVPDEELEELLYEQLQEKNIRYLGCILQNPTILKAGLLGKPVPETELYEQMKEITRLMLDEAEMEYTSSSPV